MYLEVTGKLLAISEEDDGVSDLFVIGSDSFISTPLSELKPEKPCNASEISLEIAGILRQLGEIL